MEKISKQSLILLTIVVLVAIPFGSPVLAQEYFETAEPAGGEMLYDLIVIRPVGIIATAVGTVTFVFSLPFSALGRNVDSAGQKLVKDPFKYTFLRPLGEF
jgi:hypothetical protein